MNIAITTFTWVDNYGAVLQAHALQKFLTNYGHKVLIIDYKIAKEQRGFRRFFGKNLVTTERKLKLEFFNRFRSKYMSFTTQTFRSTNDLTVLRDEFDLLITGSDQVWNPNWLSQFDGLFDLCFLTFGGFNTRRVSYAASIGHGTVNSIKPEWQVMLADRLAKMTAISVREHSGLAIIEKLCGRTDAVHVVDPTLLLDRDYYQILAGRSKKTKPYIFNYMLHGKESDSKITTESIRRNKEIRLVMCDGQSFLTKYGYVLPSPTKWLQKIRDAEIVVTNSFHAVIFCIIYHVPFFAILIDGEMSSMNTRITDLLASLGLKNRILPPNTSISAVQINSNIPWENIDTTLDQLKKPSIQYLLAQTN